MKNEKAVLLKKEILSLQEKHDELLNEIHQKHIQLKDECLHPESDLEYITKSIEGDYYNKGRFITYLVCNVCEKREFVKEEIGSYG